MIGTLINEFDNLEKPTLKDFNNTFKMSLEGAENAPVKIGVMVVGGLREVFIGDKIELIELKRMPDEEKKPEEIYISYKVSFEDEYVCHCSSFGKVAHMLQSNEATIRRYEKEQWTYYGYLVKKDIVSRDKFLEVQKLPTPEPVVLDKTKRRVNKEGSGRPSLYNYKLTVVETELEFSSIGKLCEYLDVSRKLVETRLRKYPEGKRIGGWSITREPITKDK